MHRILTLFFAVAAAFSAFAQQGPLYFAGSSNFSGVFMGIEASQDNLCDTICFELKSQAAGDIALPALTFNEMGMTIPGFTIHGATLDFDAATLSATFHAEQPFSETVCVGGVEKTISGTLHEAAYNHAERSFSLRVTYTYGAMPGAITYVMTGKHVVPEGLGSVTVAKPAESAYDLYGKRVDARRQRGVCIVNGRKTIRE